MRRPSVFLIGETERELETAAEPLLALADVHRFSDSNTAATQISQGAAPPELIVLVQLRHGVHSDADVHCLRKLAPLARLCRVLGSWCEGERRTSPAPPGCIDVYWHQWPSRASRLLDARAALPVTATADERTLAEADEPLRQRQGRIVICAQTAEVAQALAAVCHLGGYRTSIVSNRKPWNADDAVAVLLDLPMWDEQTVQLAVDRAGGVPLLVVLGFPRDEEVKRATAIGAAGVISKPFQIRDVLWRLERLAQLRAG